MNLRSVSFERLDTCSLENDGVLTSDLDKVDLGRRRLVAECCCSDFLYPDSADEFCWLKCISFLKILLNLII
jgi:hypothetical protein